MAINTLKTRIQSKYDTLVNWNASTFIPLSGELCVAIIPNTNGTTVVGDPVADQLSPYAIGIKVGDGSHKFSELPWIQAIAGDVYGWAKAADRPSADNIYVTYNTTNDKTIQQAISDIKTSIGGIVSSGISADALSSALNQLQSQLTGQTREVFNSNPLSEDDPPVVTYPTKIIRTLTQDGLNISATSSALIEEDLPDIHLNKISDLEFNTTYNKDTNKAATMADITTYVTDKLSKAMTFIGVSSTEIKEGKVENYTYPTINGTLKTNLAVGDVVLYRTSKIVGSETITSDLEFVWTDDNIGWELIGDEGSYAIRGNIKKSDLVQDLQNEISNKLDSTTAASTYVPKNGTDHLITDAQDSKLAAIEENAQVNVLEKVSVNGTELTISNKGVNVLIPITTINSVDKTGAITEVTPTNNAINFNEIAFNGEVRNLKQTDNTILIFNCGSATEIIN